MPALVDLSHEFADGMPGFRMVEDGETVEFSAEIRPFRTREEMAPHYAEGVSFEITEVRFQTSVGTYLDSPYHRYPEGGDVSELGLDEVVRPGVAVDVRGAEPGEAVGPEFLPDGDLDGRAVLFCFGWDDHWGSEQYYEYPFIGEGVVDKLLDRGAARGGGCRRDAGARVRRGVVSGPGATTRTGHIETSTAVGRSDSGASRPAVFDA